MASKLNIKDRFGDDRWPNVIARAGQFGQGGQHVDFGERMGRGLQPRSGGGDHLAKFDEHVKLTLSELVLGGEDFLFVLLELWRYVALGIFERLLADVIRRHLLAMRMRDLKIIPKHRIEA